MKRLLFIMIAVALMFSTVACSGITGAKNPNGNKVLFIGGKVGDPNMIKKIKEFGYDVTVKEDKDVTAEDAKNYGLIYISYTASDKIIGTQLIGIPVPIIYTNKNVAYVHHLVKDRDHIGQMVTEQKDAITTIDIVDEKSPIAAGLKGTVNVFTAPSNARFINPVNSGKIVASVTGDKTKGTIVTFEKGSMDTEGKPFAARQVYYYSFYNAEGNTTPEGWKILEAMLKWAISNK